VRHALLALISLLVLTPARPESALAQGVVSTLYECDLAEEYSTRPDIAVRATLAWLNEHGWYGTRDRVTTLRQLWARVPDEQRQANRQWLLDHADTVITMALGAHGAALVDPAPRARSESLDSAVLDAVETLLVYRGLADPPYTTPFSRQVPEQADRIAGGETNTVTNTAATYRDICARQPR
jgi:hypothetical protein